MRLNPIFTSHMVFAADKPVRIYGEGEGDITVSMAGQIKKTAAQNGKWMAELEKMPCGGPYELIISSGTEKIVLEDVWMGQVYLCAGQSNMQLRLEETLFPQEQYESNGSLRFFATARMEDNEPFFPQDGWMISTRETAGQRSAIGYLAGNEMTRRKQSAVGIICCYQGASIIESWVPAGTFERAGIDIPLEQRHPERAAGKDAAWNEDGALYEYGLSQVVPFSLSGVFWYQGESDGLRAEGREYAAELKELIAVWRRDFGDEKLPFVIVQLADFCKAADPEGWKLIQAAQAEVGRTVNGVSTVVCADVCENHLIHPMKKEELSHRAAEAMDSLT